IRIGADAPSPGPVPLPVASAATAESAPPPASVEAPAVTFCAKHRQQPVTNACLVCGKPICLKCMEQFGYLCSVYCQGQAEQRGIEVPFYEGQKFAVKAKEWRKTKLALAGIAGVVALLFAAYGWYVFVGCKPRTLYSVQTTRTDRPVHSQLLSTDELLLLRANKLALINVANEKEIWSATLPAAKPPAPSAPAPAKAPLALAVGDDDDFFDPLPPEVHVAGEDIWVSLADRIVRFDRKTGKQKAEVPIKDRIQQVEFTDRSILVMAENPARQKSITHILLPSGTARTEVLAAAPLPRFATGRPAARPVAQPRASGDEDAFDAGGIGDFALSDREFLPAGDNVVQFKATLLEKRLVVVQAMKAAPAESTFNSGGLSARDSLKATTELLNEMQRERTGGVTYENESRYQVTLRRLAPADSPEWKGEVIGPPSLFPQKTVDVLAAGKAVHVFSKKNQKLWEGKLTYPVAFDNDDAVSPCLEEAGSLYLFDKGMLTAFDVRTGNARWRVPSVGISRVVRDSRGMLYVSTTSASPDSIQYSQQIKLTDRPHPVIMKVDASSGKVLWKADQLGEQCYVSGKYVYVTESRISGLDVIRTGGDDRNIPIHHRIYRLDPSNGKYIWQYYQPQAPRHISVQQNRLLLQYADEVRVLSYL
ncbi:MAG TPA: PQQ-binding-like beta-propeller repeat protein, partial [Verrucomicrobiae bacterium]|nr:PQQ-binding-like beta-propeller repeat protein [Verrucomicrobiae bacterium]